MNIDVTEFRFREGDEVDLGLWATKVKPLCKSKKAYRKVLQDQVEQLSDQQRLLYASSRHALLLVFQAMDTAGKRLLARIDEPDKNWKFSSADIAERKFWDIYMQAYGHALGATSTADSPWFIVPADDKDNARLIVSRIVLDALEGLKLSYPEVTAARRQELKAIRKQLAK